MGTHIRSLKWVVGMVASVVMVACSPQPKKTDSESKEVRCPVETDCASDALHVASPDWRDQIIYFLMIDRFNDGNPDNNDQGMGEYNPAKGSHYSGGDIPGITEKLDYIQQLGATSVWLTPPVANLWWSNESSYGGYHGYWARDFSKVDEHYGTLQDYQTLSKSLHQRGMYLIQDIVVNHTAPYFGYREGAENGEGNGYDPDNTAANFELFEQGRFAAPEQVPFDKINRLDPEHEKADIYHWTPSILDFDDKHQVTHYQLANLADINTQNPEVIQAFKTIYRDWIENVGVDAYRVDTVKYVDHAFWNHFFHDEDGIYAHAKKLGKEDFLAFGEVYDVSKPFQDGGEKSLKSFYGTKDKPEFNSVIGFPLYNEIDRVFAEGKPPSYLAYRLEQHMQLPDPYIVPNFVDNHDVKRFLSSGSLPDFKQALSLIFTIPGIPVIYQGSEQAMRESRRAMFKGGYLSEQDNFDTQSEMFQFIQKLAQVRRANKILSRGTLKVLHATDTGSGIFAFRRQYQGDSVLVLMNTAAHSTLVNHLASGFSTGTTPKVLFQEGDIRLPQIGSGGMLNMVLPAKSIVVLKNSQQQGSADSGNIDNESYRRSDDITIVLDDNIDGEVFDRDIQISGTITEPNAELLLILNGNLDRARRLQANSQGRFDFTLPVRNWGKNQYSMEVYAPKLGVTSNRQIFITLVTRPEVEASMQDPAGDDKGLNGLYQQPQHANSQRQMDILAVDAKAAGSNLELVLTMQQISDVWGPSNGFDNVAFTIFFDFSTVIGAKVLPEIGGVMPNELDWELGNVVYGWGNYLFETNARNPSQQGERTGIAPKVSVDKDNNQIRLLYQGEELGIPTWRGTNVYVTTWDISGEGTYRGVGSKADAWQFGDAGDLKVKIMDDLLLSLE